MSQPATPADKLDALRDTIASLSGTLLADVGQDDVAAINSVIALDDALGGLTALLGLVPGLLAVASLGRDLDERVTALRAEVERQRTALAAGRAAIDANRELAEALDEVKAERQRLAARVAELEQVKTMMAELPALRAAVAALEDGIAQSPDRDAEEVASRFSAALRALADLTISQRSVLGADLSAMTDEVESTAKQVAQQREELAELTAQLAAQAAVAEELKAETGQHLPALALHLEADSKLTDGLDAAAIPAGPSSVDRMKTAIDAIANRLADLDQTLKPLLAAHSLAYEQARQIRR